MNFFVADSFTRRIEYLPPERDNINVTSEVASGSIWSGIGLGGTLVLNLVRSMIFARLLMPEDFGILSLATVFTQFVLIFANFGIGASVVFHKQINKNDLSTCWWGNLFIDTTAAIACVVVAILSANTDSDNSIIYVVGLLSLQFLITAIGSINGSLMKREFKYKEIATVNFAGAVITFLTSWFCVAVLNWGVYGLCTGMIGGSLGMAIMNFWYMPWLPSFLFSRESFHKHLGYGRWFLGVNVIQFMNQNADRFIINALLNKTQLGFYEYASNIPLMVAERLAMVLNSVLFSAFSSVQDKPEELRQLLKKIYKYNSIIIFPFLTGLALVAPDFILVAYSDKWLPILTPLRLFCFYGILRLYTQPLLVLCNGIGKPNLPFKWLAIYLPINVLFMYLGVSKGGTIGAVTAKIFLPVFMAITVGREIMRTIELPWRRLFISTWPAVSSCLAMGAAVWALQFFYTSSLEIPIVRLGLQVLTGILVYVGSMLTFFQSDTRKIVALAERFRNKNS